MSTTNSLSWPMGACIVVVPHITTVLSCNASSIMIGPMRMSEQSTMVVRKNVQKSESRKGASWNVLKNELNKILLQAVGFFLNVNQQGCSLYCFSGAALLVLFS